MAQRREPVSVVCVWNNEATRSECLDRSLAALQHSTRAVDFVPVDNRGQRHSTAGAALNAGVHDATNEFVAFIQQDIFVHSLTALETAAGLLADRPELGLIGAVGIDPQGRILGRMRDRVVLIGGSRPEPTLVDSLDEVLFIGRRSQLLESPLSEDPALAWHAYAVEYGLRLRARGQSVVAMDLPITHNSLSTNLARLDEAHATVARMHPDLLPIQTTCGKINAASLGPRPRFLQEHGLGHRRLRRVVAARRAAWAASSSRVLVSDARRDIDPVLSAVGVEELHIHNVSHLPFPDAPGGTHLSRHGRSVRFTAGPVGSVLGDWDAASCVLLTNVARSDLIALRAFLAGTPHVIGCHEDAGTWVLLGAASDCAWKRLRSESRDGVA